MRRFDRMILSILVSVLCAGALSADEGLWLFNKFPVELVKAGYGFTVTQPWLDHFRLSCVNMGGSASFVAPDGLLVTNHHVGAGAIQRLGTKDRDLMKTGFYAPTRAEELACPGLDVMVLQGIEDATARVQGAVKTGMTAAEAGRAMAAAIAEIEAESTRTTGLRSRVVTLYEGGMYHLYLYKAFTDVRLVFAPEQQITFFGGDPDNYGYPRYALDVAFFRVYENGQPYRTPHHLTWNTTGLTENELVFAAGNPQRTSRRLTMSQLEFFRDVYYPLLVASFIGQRDAFAAYMSKGPEPARIGFRRHWGSLNEIKCFKGQLDGLTDPEIMTAKARAEKELRETVRRDPRLAETYGRAWDEIAEAQRKYAEFFKSHFFLVQGEGLDSTYIGLAKTVLQLAASPESADFAVLERRYYATPFADDFETVRLATSLRLWKTHQPESPELALVLAGRTPEEAAQALVAGTRLDDPAVVRALVQGGSEKLKASTDSFVKLALSLKPASDELARRYRDEVQSVEVKNGSLLAKLLFELKGTTLPPDATQTLRLSFGAVRGYVEDDGTRIPFQTTYRGLYEKAERHNFEFPYDLPRSFLDARPKVDLDAPYNFVATCDASGGNSGSPLVNAKGEFVGILFDGNRQSLPHRFLYSDKQVRSVMVHAGGILEALRSVYGARELIRELTGGVDSARPSR